MLRPNGNSREIREGYLVSLPYCSIRAAQARRSQGYVFAMPAGRARRAYAGRQEQSGIKNLHRRRTACASAVLDAFSCVDSMHDGTPKSNRPGVGGRGWGHGQCMDKAQEGSGVSISWAIGFGKHTSCFARTPCFGQSERLPGMSAIKTRNH